MVGHRIERKSSPSSADVERFSTAYVVNGKSVRQRLGVGTDLLSVFDVGHMAHKLPKLGTGHQPLRELWEANRTTAILFGFVLVSLVLILMCAF